MGLGGKAGRKVGLTRALAVQLVPRAVPAVPRQHGKGASHCSMIACQCSHFRRRAVTLDPLLSASPPYPTSALLWSRRVSSDHPSP